MSTLAEVRETFYGVRSTVRQMPQEALEEHCRQVSEELLSVCASMLSILTKVTNNNEL